MARSVTAPVSGIDGDVGEFQLAFERIFRAVFQPQPDAAHFFGILVDLAFGNRLAQRQQLRARLRNVDIDRIQPLYRCQRIRLTGCDQRTFRYTGDADASSDRCNDARVAEIDVRRLRVRDSLFVGGERVIVVLRCDGALLQQHAVAFRFGFGGRQRGGRVAVARLIGRGIDLVEGLPFLYRAAFDEQPLQHNAAHLRPHFRNPVWCSPAGQFGRQGRRSWMDDHDANLGRRHLLMCVVTAAGRQEANERKKGGGESGTGCW